MLRLTQVSLRGVLALASFIALQPGLALSDANSPYCWPEERFAPDGRIVELGGRFFHLCGADGAAFPYNLDSDIGKPAIRISPKSSKVHEVEAATNPPKFLWGYMTFEENWYISGLANIKRHWHNHIGEIRLGDADYQVYLSETGLRYHPGAAEKGKLPEDAFYVFDRPEGSDIPEHHISCRGDPTAEPRVEYDCFIYLKYRERDDFVIEHRLSWAPIYAGGPMDFERLTDLVRAVHALFEHVDVTDRLDTLEGVPIVRVPE